MIKSQKIEKVAILILVATLLMARSQQIIADGCVEFTSGSCARCKRQTHVYQGVCYKNMLGCLQYKTGNECSLCEAPTFIIRNGRCNAVGGEAVSVQLMADLYKYSGQYDEDPGDMYGQSSFAPTTFETVKRWPSFLALDTFVRRGQYGHYISRMSNPVYSVHYYQNKDTYIYKVLYYGSGGGLFLCIADVPPTYKVELRSLTPISASNVIDNCWDYDTNGRCIRCKDGAHLESGKCYSNYGGCIRYVQNICLECLDYYLLVENRCTSDCLSLSDARSILHYETSRNQSTLQTMYSTSISIFYAATITVTTTKQVTTYTIDSIGSNVQQSGSSSSSSSSSPIHSTSTLVSSPTSSSSIQGSTASTKPAPSSNVVQGSSTFSSSVVSSSLSSSPQISASNTVSPTSSASNQGSTYKNASNAAQTQKLYVVDINNNTYLANDANSIILNQIQANSTNFNIINTNSFQSSAFTVQPITMSNQTVIKYQVITAQSPIITSIGSNITQGKINSLRDSQDYLSAILEKDMVSSSQSGGFASDSHCLEVKNGQCQKCIEFYFKNENGLCEQLSMLCVDVSPTDGSCKKCFEGYLLRKGRCQIRDFS